MESLVELFCHVDGFCKVFLPTMDKKVIYVEPKKSFSVEWRRSHYNDTLIN
jgi:hypothetical protein